MVERIWTDVVQEISEYYPISEPGQPYPEIARALDEGIDDLLREPDPEPMAYANPLYVEDLLRDCVNRIGNCLAIRERAQELESRAMSEGLNYGVQTTSLDIQAQISAVMELAAPKLAQNATGFQLSQTTASPIMDERPWVAVAKLRTELKDKLQASLEAIRAKAVAPGNAANYIERFDFYKTLFDLNIVDCYKRALVCSVALDKIYGIKARLPAITKIGYLNQLTLWAQTCSNALDRELDVRLYGQIAFSLTSTDANRNDYQLLQKAAFDAGRASGKFEFSLTSKPFELQGMQQVLLRSVRLQAESADNTKSRIWQANLTLPKPAVASATPRFACIAPNTFETSPDPESVIRGVHNLSPLGAWELSVVDKNLSGEMTAAALTNLFLVLTVSYRPFGQ